MNGTRIAAHHGLLSSLIRMHGPISVYIAQHQMEPKIQKLKLDDSQIADLLVFEGVLEIVAKATTLAQYETCFTGAYGPVIRSLVLADLRADHGERRLRSVTSLRTPSSLCSGCPAPVLLSSALHPVTLRHRSAVLIIDSSAIVARKPRLMRKPFLVRDMSPTAKRCLTRAALEAERRFAGNVTDEITGAAPLIDDRELVMILLDPRTSNLLKDIATQWKAFKLFVAAHVEFTINATKFARAG